MSAAWNETVLISGVVNSVSYAVGSYEFEEPSYSHALSLVVDLLNFTSLLSEDLVLSLIQIVISVGQDVGLLTDDTVLIIVVSRNSRD